jgi:GTPase SAR1 family protein
MANERVTILSLGEGAVGKSSLTLSFLKRGFVDEVSSTCRAIDP